MDSQIIANINDEFRKTFVGGKVLLTEGIQCLPDDKQNELIKMVQNHSKFDEDNDPYGEHDFGVVELDNQKHFWKIDYYDKNYEFMSPDPKDRQQTNRVLTIMCSHEY